jgi:hypothetical protein
MISALVTGDVVAAAPAVMAETSVLACTLGRFYEALSAVIYGQNLTT